MPSRQHTNCGQERAPAGAEEKSYRRSIHRRWLWKALSGQKWVSSKGTSSIHPPSQPLDLLDSVPSSRPAINGWATVLSHLLLLHFYSTTSPSIHLFNSVASTLFNPGLVLLHRGGLSCPPAPADSTSSIRAIGLLLLVAGALSVQTNVLSFALIGFSFPFRGTPLTGGRNVLCMHSFNGDMLRVHMDMHMYESYRCAKKEFCVAKDSPYRLCRPRRVFLMIYLPTTVNNGVC